MLFKLFIFFTYSLQHHYTQGFGTIKGVLLTTFEVNNSNCENNGRYLNFVLINIENDKALIKFDDFIKFNLLLSVTLNDHTNIAETEYNTLFDLNAIPDTPTTKNNTANFYQLKTKQLVNNIIYKVKNTLQSDFIVKELTQRLPSVTFGNENMNPEYVKSLTTSIMLVPTVDAMYRNNLCGKSYLITNLIYSEYKDNININVDSKYSSAHTITIPIILYNNRNRDSGNISIDENSLDDKDTNAIKKNFDEIWKENEEGLFDDHNRAKVKYKNDEKRKKFYPTEIFIIIGLSFMGILIIITFINEKINN
eukprot:GAHX01000228.1.p1 GENE.GAHX01000228.1~~GAHX01000228.1.p1  ORF type:complete len:308 (+),score=59.86 GAHX01000228.1:475-1398(+)